MSNMNVKTLPADPLDKGEENEEATKPVKTKRTRRTKAQIEADKAAVALGFKDAADQAAQEDALGEATGLETEKKDNLEESPAVGQDTSATVADVPKEVIPVTEDTISFGLKSGLTPGQRWNLGGSTYIVDYLHDGGVTFLPADRWPRKSVTK